MYENFLIIFGIAFFITIFCFIIKMDIDNKIKITNKKIKIMNKKIKITHGMLRKMNKKTPKKITQGIKLQAVDENEQNIFFTNPEKPDSNDNEKNKNDDDKDSLFIVN